VREEGLGAAGGAAHWRGSLGKGLGCVVEVLTAAAPVQAVDDVRQRLCGFLEDPSECQAQMRCHMHCHR
jgi:hypothetical protein